MIVRITSDGTMPGTKVYDEEGNEIKNVIEAVWAFSAMDPCPRLTLKFLGEFPINAVGEVDERRA